MGTTVLIIGVIKKGDAILFRKKPDGSPPYKETGYLFGGEVNSDTPSPEEVLKAEAKKQAGIDIEVKSRITWDTEIKPNHDGIQTFYVYLDSVCEYLGGELNPGPGIEKLEWVPISELSNYDLVPPSKKLLSRMNYL